MSECTFCGKGEAEVGRLEAGLTANICDACLQLCRDIVAERLPPWEKTVGDDLRCAFCGQDHRRSMIAGPIQYICFDCVARLCPPESN